jgi:hypothetical protein
MSRFDEMVSGVIRPSPDYSRDPTNSSRRGLRTNARNVPGGDRKDISFDLPASSLARLWLIDQGGGPDEGRVAVAGKGIQTGSRRAGRRWCGNRLIRVAGYLPFALSALVTLALHRASGFS